MPRVYRFRALYLDFIEVRFFLRTFGIIELSKNRLESFLFKLFNFVVLQAINCAQLLSVKTCMA